MSALTTLTTLAGKIASEHAVVAATAAVAPLKAFATSFRDAEAKKGAAITVPVFSVGTAQAFDKASNNYAGSDKNVSGVDVELNQHLVLSQVYEDQDFVDCDAPFWRGAGEAIGKALALGAVKTAVGLINKTNVPKSGTGFSAANELVFTASKANLAALRAQCATLGIDPADASIILNGAAFASILAALDANVYGGAEAIKGGAIPGLYGFAGVYECNQLTTGTGEYLVGAIVAKDALAVAARYLEPQSKKGLEEFGHASDDATGFPIGMRRFGDAKTGENYIAGDVLFGAKLLQPAKICRLVSQATA